MEDMFQGGLHKLRMLSQDFCCRLGGVGRRTLPNCQNDTSVPLHTNYYQCYTATVLESLFKECHSASAALGGQHPEVTKQPLVHDTRSAVMLYSSLCSE